jgi:hypothetical protein
MAQMALYVQPAPSPWGGRALGCLVGTLIDGVGIALIYGFGAVLFRSPTWVCRPGGRRWLLTLGLGFVGAVLVERAALILGWWRYGAAMPIVPGLEVGLSPLLQFLVLPPIVLFFCTCRQWRGR